ncbi:phenol 2-monooxygenase [Roseiarcus fermentans]|uniref:Phenol 2-monooxygenase n=1 Tax=Roseiarcus fermentans TaxID=1473586 RepID=A0A366FVM6_9HYPH|nr:FAD-dependent monooxygenase [Roseiarcus fermentans]RBP17749.1 phenol 2-monooxygenase [Roseiarcus fermentans]
MQFYLDAFRTGDPELLPPNPDPAMLADTDALPDEVDVLIVGCGPAGLTLAAQLSRFPAIRTRIVEQKDGPLMFGQADGIACRSMEMFQAFAMRERVEREAYWVNETAFWKPSAERPGEIVRSGLIQDVEDGLAPYPHVIINQARVHQFFLDIMARAPNRLIPNYHRRFAGLEIGADAVTARIERLDDAHEGEIETVRARYVVGADGARSSVREALGFRLVGDAANQAWGVMDVLAVTDFPDIRKKCVIQSEREGNVLVIPREGGYMLRIYVEMDKLAGNERVTDRAIGLDDIVRAAERIFRPYTFEAKSVSWWSVYEVGQRITDHFDDASPTQGARDPRVFIMGDACHTHSAKAGQGLNVSVMDAFNLGWKLAAVLDGRAPAALLSTYSAERRAIAQTLIDFDREWAAMMAAPLKSPAVPHGVDPAELQAYFVRHGRYTAGVATRYARSALTGGTEHQALAKGFEIGTRFHSAPVVRLADAKAIELIETMEADGRFRLIAFADRGDPAARGSKIRDFCEFVAETLAPRFTPRGRDIDAMFDLRAVFQQGHRDLDLRAMPAPLRPAKGPLGLTDYEKMFCPHFKSGVDIFDLRGVDRERGALVVVRPDQYVAHVLPLDAHAELAAFFAGFLIPVAA